MSDTNEPSIDPNFNDSEPEDYQINPTDAGPPPSLWSFPDDYNGVLY